MFDMYDTGFVVIGGMVSLMRFVPDGIRITVGSEMIWFTAFLLVIVLLGCIIAKLKQNIANLKRTEIKLQEQQDQLQTLIHALPDAINFKDAEARWIEANPPMLRLFGLEGIDVYGKTDKELAQYTSFYRDALNYCEVSDEYAWKAGKITRVEETVSQPDGSVKIYDTHKVPMFDKNGRRKGLVVIGRDITEQKQMLEALKESEKKYRTLVESSPIGVMIYQNGVIHYINPSGADILGAPSAESLQGFSVLNFIHPDVQPAVLEQIKTMAVSPQEPIEIKVVCMDKKEVYIQIFTLPIRFNGKSAVQVVFNDITERKTTDEKIRYLAFHDALTGLPNRKMMHSHLRDALKSRQTHESVAVMFIDLDSFKHINDTLNHTVGDEVLKDVAQRLQACVFDSGIACRMGGDEFAIILPNVTNMNIVQGIADGILKQLRKPLFIEDRILRVTASIGISFAPDHGEQVEPLIRSADIAMYAAKERGKNKFYVYTQELHNEYSRRLEIENALREAVENEQFEIFYQPIIDVKTGHVASLEALIRWNRPEYGFVSPTEFIPIAEETGQIISIGRWVARSVCRQIKNWQQLGYSLVPISINVSGMDFQLPDFMERFKEIVNEGEIDPKWIEIEITESALMNDIQHAMQTLKDLKEMGVRCAMDDFGTGYSSLSYLRKFPVDKLKIDRSFVKDISNQENQAILRNIIQLARNLRLLVVAEGVETQEELRFLQSEMCDYVQGYLYSQPISAAGIEDRFLK
ncbi:EAL domain-containing protein [Fodinisporobacter ferrooxydans]|uniref:EAL domain-containing protein n=1 Tax=Fodinisporobacter ferrooxydans TaxID=2901836 RepID=A0ABY4CRH8_9BACL|nr:EAL domain-containing protein [Alicyclobacillaceae bacterium MYW30-H2]